MFGQFYYTRKPNQIFGTQKVISNSCIDSHKRKFLKDQTKQIKSLGRIECPSLLRRVAWPNSLKCLILDACSWHHCKIDRKICPKCLLNNNTRGTLFFLFIFLGLMNILNNLHVDQGEIKKVYLCPCQHWQFVRLTNCPPTMSLMAPLVNPDNPPNQFQARPSTHRSSVGSLQT